MTAGQPAAGGAPSGSVSEHESCVASDAGIVSCCGVAANADPLQKSAPTIAAKRAKRRPTAFPRVAGSRIASMDPRPVGVFDSGVGGLTVLHECLVTMPHEDFVYLGDHARLPYGPRPLAEVRRFAREIGAYLEAQDVKLIVVACNTATSAALPRLQEELDGAGRRRDHARGARGRAGDAQPARSACSRRRRRSTPAATASSCTRSTPAPSFHPVACPRLVPLIESDDPFGEETERAVREYAAPLKAAGVDTVILGCTHYPLIRPIFQRVFGRDVTLVFSAEETAREVAETLARKGIENDPAREGVYRFLTTGDPETFRAIGRRFLQLPIGEVEHVTLAQLEAAAA